MKIENNKKNNQIKAKSKDINNKDINVVNKQQTKAQNKTEPYKYRKTLLLLNVIVMCIGIATLTFNLIFQDNPPVAVTVIIGVCALICFAIAAFEIAIIVKERKEKNKLKK